MCVPWLHGVHLSSGDYLHRGAIQGPLVAKELVQLWPLGQASLWHAQPEISSDALSSYTCTRPLTFSSHVLL